MASAEEMKMGGRGLVGRQERLDGRKVNGGLQQENGRQVHRHVVNKKRQPHGRQCRGQMVKGRMDRWSNRTSRRSGKKGRGRQGGCRGRGGADRRVKGWRNRRKDINAWMQFMKVSTQT